MLRLSGDPPKYFFLRDSRYNSRAHALQARAELAKCGAALVAKEGDPKECRKLLTEVFANDREIDFPTYLERIGMNPDYVTDPVARGYRFRKVTDRNTVKSELLEIAALLKDYLRNYHEKMDRNFY